MKTTLELPDDLLRRTKARASTQGRAMRDLVVEALEDKLRASASRAGWRRVFGRAPRGATRDADRRIADLERVRPEDWE